MIPPNDLYYYDLGEVKHTPESLVFHRDAANVYYQEAKSRPGRTLIYNNYKSESTDIIRDVTKLFDENDKTTGAIYHELSPKYATKIRESLPEELQYDLPGHPMHDKCMIVYQQVFNGDHLPPHIDSYHRQCIMMINIAEESTGVETAWFLPKEPDRWTEADLLFCYDDLYEVARIELPINNAALLNLQVVHTVENIKHIRRCISILWKYRSYDEILEITKKHNFKLDITV